MRGVTHHGAPRMPLSDVGGASAAIATVENSPLKRFPQIQVDLVVSVYARDLASQQRPKPGTPGLAALLARGHTSNEE